MDEKRFLEACTFTVGRAYDRNKVGLLSEKTLHATLKYYFEPDKRYHEQKIGMHYADICRDGQIFEIQTRSMNRLRDKLRAFLEEYRVCVVYPIPAEKTIAHTAVNRVQ